MFDRTTEVTSIHFSSISVTRTGKTQWTLNVGLAQMQRVLITGTGIQKRRDYAVAQTQCVHRRTASTYTATYHNSSKRVAGRSTVHGSHPIPVFHCQSPLVMKCPNAFYTIQSV
jgi:hypothetical protein